MKKQEIQHLTFVLKYYQENSLDTQKAIRKFKNNHPNYSDKRKTARSLYISAIIAACLVGFILCKIIETTPNTFIEYTTKNSISTIILPDSSVVILSPQSFLRYDSKEYNINRHIIMNGKAYFNVKRDPAHPFQVRSDFALVEVLGTQFQIDEINSESTNIEVITGKVRFSDIDNTVFTILTEGMKANLDAKDHIISVETTPSRETASQANNHFIFQNTPISVVLAELSKFYNIKITASNYNKNLTAEFKEENLDEIIKLIEDALNIKLKKDGKK